MEIKTIINILEQAVEFQKWVYEDDCAQLDEVFVIDPRYVPETDPTGSLVDRKTLVPLEQAIYGSNFSGNYYVVELFSSKKFLGAVLNKKDRAKIQKAIASCHIQYDLENLTDRVGNILCKLSGEIMEHKSLKLSPENGIVGRFLRGKNVQGEINCFLNILIVSIREYDYFVHIMR